LQNPDNFGHDYTVYVNRLEEEQVSEPAPAPKKANQEIQSCKAGNLRSALLKGTSPQRELVCRISFFFVLTTAPRFFSLISGQRNKLGKKEILPGETFCKKSPKANTCFLNS